MRVDRICKARPYRLPIDSSQVLTLGGLGRVGLEPPPHCGPRDAPSLRDLLLRRAVAVHINCQRNLLLSRDLLRTLLGGGWSGRLQGTSGLGHGRSNLPGSALDLLRHREGSYLWYQCRVWGQLEGRHRRAWPNLPVAQFFTIAADLTCALAPAGPVDLG